MKSAAFLLLASVSLAACSGDPGEDTDPVVITDSGGGDETATDTGAPPEDSAGDSDEDTADSGRDAGKLTCEGSEAEPNDTRVTAAKLKDSTDCDGTGGTIKGVVGGGSDTDWFTYSGSDTVGCRVDVVASTTSGVRLCVIASCKSGATKFEGCSKGVKTMVAGVDGCCAGPGESKAEVVLDYSCTLVGTNDGAEVYMRVDDPEGTTCKNYTVDYHF